MCRYPCERANSHGTRDFAGDSADNSPFRNVKTAQYSRQHRESVNMKAFNQSKHVTKIWYHGTAASKACLPTTPPFPFPQTTAGLASLADFLPI